RFGCRFPRSRRLSLSRNQPRLFPLQESSQLPDDAFIVNDNRQQSILVVEDERNTRLALQRFLRRAGWEPLCFGTAAETLPWISHPPDAGPVSAPIGGAVIDIHLPDGDGIDLTRAMRNHLGPDVPIVIVSGDTSMETLARLRDAGGNRFVGKPMSLQALRDALEGRT